MRKTLSKKQKIRLSINKFSHVAIAVAACVMLVAIVEWARGFSRTEFREGDIVLKAIYAPYDFVVKGDINYRATEEARKEVTDTVAPVYVFDAEAVDHLLKKSKAFFESVMGLKNQEAAIEGLEARIREIASAHGIPEAVVKGVLELKDPMSFFKDAEAALRHVMEQGVISAADVARMKETGLKTIRILDRAANKEDAVSTHELMTPQDARKKAEQTVAAAKDRKEKALLSDFVGAMAYPNITYDKEGTESRKQGAAGKIQPIYNMVEIKKNELILNKGERVLKEDISKLEAIEQRDSYSGKMGQSSGMAIIIILFMLLLVLYIEFYEPDLIVGNKELVLLSAVCILTVLSAKLIVVSPWPSTMISVSAASMLIAILLNSRLAIITTCFLSILVGMISVNRLDIVAMSVVGGMIGIFAVKNVRRRSQLIVAGFSVGFANMSYLIGVGLVNSLEFNTYITEAFLGLANGVISAVVVTGVLPIFENMFKVVTDISLLELSDLNHPILKEMVMKAPGTYHHSLVVGNLAEAACESIGANSLLARVSSYFHDIGKIEKASYFSENQSTPESAHDKLTPTMSSLIITNHVKNGVELAQKHNLNNKIIDIIKQHHGTGLVFYFFKRALEKTMEEVAEEGFRYPGPKPQTREAACVLLADSVEAASRSVDDPTPASIKGLVRKIINNKFIDGQLDECDLTLKDLEKIAEVFTHILTGMYHTRVEYPEETGKK
ncbi:MAG: HDIG domain-containing metalloprotein [Candidatus Omnitrophota bacterium]